MIQTTSCSKIASEISNKAIEHMMNIEWSIARGMAQSALMIDSNCGCAKLTIAAISNGSKDWQGTRVDKLNKIDRSKLSGEEQVWFDYLMAGSDKEKYSAVQKAGEKKFPNSPLVSYLATRGLDMDSYKTYAEKFPNYASSAYNMMSYGYLRGDYESVDNEKAMEYVKKAQEMHDGPNAYDSMAEHYASLGDYENALIYQLKAHDYAAFNSPYQSRIGEYWKKANKDTVVKNLMKAQSDMQDAILKADYTAFEKFTHPDIKISTGDSNLGKFYEFTRESLEADQNLSWDEFELKDMNVYFSPDMKTAVVTFYAKGAYTINGDSKNSSIDLNGMFKSISTEYSTRGSSVWVETDGGWKTMHSNFAPNKGKVGLPQN